ncbi:hypothetical protein THAOC_01740, partial [Thalassiosira oceanica]
RHPRPPAVFLVGVAAPTPPLGERGRHRRPRGEGAGGARTVRTAVTVVRRPVAEGTGSRRSGRSKAPTAPRGTTRRRGRTPPQAPYPDGRGGGGGRRPRPPRAGDARGPWEVFRVKSAQSRLAARETPFPFRADGQLQLSVEQLTLQRRYTVSELPLSESAANLIRDFLFPPTVLTTKNYNGANDMSLRQNGQRAQSHSNGQCGGVKRGGPQRSQPQGGEELSKTQTIQTMM